MNISKSIRIRREKGKKRQRTIWLCLIFYSIISVIIIYILGNSNILLLIFLSIIGVILWISIYFIMQKHYKKLWK